MQLAALIKEKYDKYDSFIITHGTNTLGYTCAALSFSLANPNKPITRWKALILQATQSVLQAVEHTENQTFGSALGQPLTILQGRIFRAALQMKF